MIKTEALIIEWIPIEKELPQYHDYIWIQKKSGQVYTRDVIYLHDSYCFLLNDDEEVPIDDVCYWAYAVLPKGVSND